MCHVVAPSEAGLELPYLVPSMNKKQENEVIG